MGDIADEHYNQMVDDGTLFHRTYGPPLKCRHCGATGLYWQRVKGKYRLFERATIAQHVCPITTDDMPLMEDESV